MVISESRSTIIAVGDNPTWIERHAARELAGYVGKMSGAQLNMVCASDEACRVRGNVILIGRSETNALVKQLCHKRSIRLSVDDPGLDGFIVRTLSDDGRHYLVLAGSVDRGTLYAVYHFLENFLNIGFFEDGDYVPSNSVLEIGAIDIGARPRFPTRQIFHEYT